MVEALVRSVDLAPGQPVADQVGDQQRGVGERRAGRRARRRPAGYIVLNGRNCKPLRAYRSCPCDQRGVHGVDAASRSGRRGSGTAARAVSRRAAARSRRPRSRPRRRPGRRRRATGLAPDPSQTLREQPGQVPVHRGAAAVPQIHRIVGEAVHLRASRSGAGPTSASMTRPLVAPRSTAANLRRSTHRRKAAATPASTGTCSPVVCEKSDVHSANAALAMFSGSTSRLSRVRCA